MHARPPQREQRHRDIALHIHSHKCDWRALGYREWWWSSASSTLLQKEQVRDITSPGFTSHSHPLSIIQFTANGIVSIQQEPFPVHCTILLADTWRACRAQNIFIHYHHHRFYLQRDKPVNSSPFASPSLIWAPFLTLTSSSCVPCYHNQLHCPTVIWQSDRRTAIHKRIRNAM